MFLATKPLMARAWTASPRRRIAIRCTSKLPPPDLSKLAEMARIAITEDELRDWKPKVEEIIAWFGQLQSIDLSGVSPQLRAANAPGDHILRDDAVESYSRVEEMMGQVPEQENGFLKVPKIGGGGD